jgi:predicted enzyme related to lactoylglutathione lyase
MSEQRAGLAGVLISTPEDRFEAMKAFYTGTLGLVPRSVRPGFVNFELAGGRLTIASHDRVVGVSRDPLRVMVNLAVSDLTEWHRRLTMAGVSCLRDPSPEPWGGQVATYSDPDGNTLQLMTGTAAADASLAPVRPTSPPP